MADYCALVSPRCSGCGDHIQPLEETGILVRIQVRGPSYTSSHVAYILKAMNQSFHVDCFACDVCGCRLSDDPGERWTHVYNMHVYGT